MKKHLLALFIFGISSFALKAQTPFHHFSYRLGGTDNDRGRDHALDTQGNIYLAGTFLGTVIDLDPSAATFTMSGTTTYNRSAIIKTSPQGQFIWGVKVGAGGFDISVNGIATDASDNVYVTGNFEGTSVDFDPTAATYTLASNNASSDNYVAKFNSSGVFQWAIGFGGDQADYSVDIKVSPSGNVYVCGGVEGANCDFDPSAGTAILTPITFKDAFVAKYNTNGQYQWAFLTGGSSNSDEWQSLALDASENVYTMGTFMGGSIDLNPGAGTAILSASASDLDLFLGKYNSSGQYQWAFKIASAGDEITGGLAIDQSGNLLATGVFNGNGVDFDPGAGSALLNGAGYAGFVAKYSAAGAYQSAFKILGISTNIYPTCDGAGNTFITGSFFGTADFDPGAGTVNLTSVSTDEDIFVAKYSSSNVYQWAFSMGGSTYDYGTAITVDGLDNVVICGSYNSSAFDCDPGAGTSSITNAGMSDVFLARYSQRIDIGVKEFNNNIEASVYPNPSSGIFNIQTNFVDKVDATVYNSIGQIVKRYVNLNGNNTIDMSGFAKGVYSIILTSNDNYKTIKLVID